LSNTSDKRGLTHFSHDVRIQSQSDDEKKKGDAYFGKKLYLVASLENIEYVRSDDNTCGDITDDEGLFEKFYYKRNESSNNYNNRNFDKNGHFFFFIIALINAVKRGCGESGRALNSG